VDNLTIEADAKVGDKWVDLGLKCSIPTNILDIVSSNLPTQVSASQDKVMNISVMG
jgi:hypothetical protein